MSVLERFHAEPPTIEPVDRLTPVTRAVPVVTPTVPAANPAMIGLPTFIAGSVALGLSLIGYIPVASQGATIPLILAASGLGSLIATLWAMRLGESAVAGIFGTFTAFWTSYAVLELGFVHRWFGVATADFQHTAAMFAISWLVVVGVLTLFTLALPKAYTVLFTLIELSLALSLAANLGTSTTLAKLAGYVVLAFTAVGVYLFSSACLEATGRKALPLGKPLLKI